MLHYSKSPEISTNYANVSAYHPMRLVSNMQSFDIPAECLKKIKAVSTRLNSEDHIVKIFGKELITMNGDKGISRELALFKIHEPKTTGFLKTILGKDMICLEIGANIGYYVLLEASLIGPKGRVIAVEPSPRSFAYLCRTISLNDLKNVETYQLALGSDDCTLNFVVSQSSNHNHVLLENQKVMQAQLISVPSMKLDTFVRKLGLQRLDMLRMDVEGYESSIVEGSSETLKRFHPFILMELHIRTDRSKAVKVLQDLRASGYNIRCSIPRSFDYPFFHRFSIGISEIDISNLIDRIERMEMLPNEYNLFLK
jgi:FkbM family methyltransferase